MDIHDWCRVSGLSSSTAAKLRHEGFATAEELRDVTDDDVRVTFQKPRKLPLQQCVALREALRDFRQGRGKRRQQDGAAITEWCSQHSLDAETRNILENEGFTTADDLKCVTASDVKTTFQKKGLLSLQQCIALRRAVEEEEEEDDEGGNSQTRGSTSSRLTNGRRGIQPPEAGNHGGTSEALLHTSITVPPADDGHQRLGVRPRRRQSGDQGKEYRLVIVGSDGSGKTRTVHSILGHLGDSILKPQGATHSGGGLYHGLVCGHPVKILDSSGWLNASRGYTDTATRLTDDLSLLHPGPHALLYTVDVSSRYTKEHSTRFAHLDAIFNHRLHSDLVVVFTHGDCLEHHSNSSRSSRTIEDLVRTAPSDLRELLRRCEDRYVLLDNNTPNPQQRNGYEVTKLLRLVEDLVTRRIHQRGRRVAEAPGSVEGIVRRLKEVDAGVGGVVMVDRSSSVVVQSRGSEQKESPKKVKRSRKVLDKRRVEVESRECLDQKIGGDLEA